MIIERERVVPSAQAFRRIERQGVEVQLGGERTQFGDVLFRGVCRQIDATDPSNSTHWRGSGTPAALTVTTRSPSSVRTGEGTPIAVSVASASNQLISASISAGERRFGKVHAKDEGSPLPHPPGTPR